MMERMYRACCVCVCVQIEVPPHSLHFPQPFSVPRPLPSPPSPPSLPPQFHIWLKTEIPDGQPKALLNLLPGYPLINFALVSAGGAGDREDRGKRVVGRRGGVAREGHRKGIDADGGEGKGNAPPPPLPPPLPPPPLTFSPPSSQVMSLSFTASSS